MAKGGFTVDDRQFQEMVKSLTGTQIKRAYRRAIKKSADILKRETDRQFAERTHLNTRKPQTISKNKKAVKKTNFGTATVRIYMKGNQIPSAKVHIMSDYMMKWFELGTKERKTKGRKVIGIFQFRTGGRRYKLRIGKGRRTGKIEPMYLFRKAQNATESEIFKNMRDLTKKEILTTYRRACRKNKK